MFSPQGFCALLFSGFRRITNRGFGVVLLLTLLSGADKPLAAQTGYFNPVQTTIGNGFFALPFGAVVAGNGDIYVADTFHNAIKRIVAVNGVVPANPSIITLFGTFYRPIGLAVDTSGNVYEADSQSGLVNMLVAVNGVVPNSPVINTLATGFTTPTGVAVDANRNVYVADSQKHSIYELLAAGGYTSFHVLGSGLVSPTGVAVDSSGNLYVAEEGANSVVELTAASSYATAVPLGSGFNAPYGIAVDASGDVYVADKGNDSVKEMLAVGGAVPASPTILTLASVIPVPYGVAIDGHGNVLIAPEESDVIELATTTANFGQVSVGVATPPQQILTFTFTAPGTIDPPKVLTLGATNQDFTDTGAGTCTTNGASHPYLIGDTCTVAVSFNPAYAGLRSGEVQITSGSTIVGSFYLAGTGIGPQVVFNPYNLIDVGNNSYSPGNMALDSSGNIFLADDANGEVEELTAASGYATTIQLAPGTINSGNGNAPSDVVIDGAGNLFVSDRFQHEIYELTAASGYNTVITVATGVQSIYGLTMDSAGNLFAACNPLFGGTSQVIEILAVNGTIPSNPTIVPLGGSYSFFYPSGVALDSAGNLFVADSGNAALVELTAASNYTAATQIATGFSFAYPTGLAMDAANNLYVADASNQQADEVLAAGGYTNVNVLISGLGGYPYGIALDQKGDVFIGEADGGIPLLELDYADPPSLNFAATHVGSTSSDSPQTVTYTNNGNDTLTFSAPLPYIPQLSFYIDGSSTCPAVLPISLAPGGSCTETVVFKPTVGGPLLGQLITTDNNLNGNNSSQIVSLSGTGVGIPNAITIIPATLPGGTVGAPYSQTVSATGGVSPYTFSVVSGSIPTGLSLVGGVLSGTPTVNGSFNFTVQGIDHNGTNAIQAYSVSIAVPAQTITFPQPSAAVDYTSATLTATASSGLAVTYTVVSGPGYVNGSTILYTGVGTVVVEADQAGDITHLPALPVQRSITVTEFSQPVASTSATLSALVTFTAAGILNNIQALTQGVANLDFSGAVGGTCTASTHYSIGDTCIAAFTFKPAYPGQRYGALMLTDSSGTMLATSYIYANGIGPQIGFYPATQNILLYSMFDDGIAAVDSTGNLYLSTGFDHNVYKETPTGGGNYTQSLVAGGSSFFPGGVAVDGAGNIYIADVYANRVVKETPSGSSYMQSTVLTGYNQPASVAVDGVGNLYVSDAIDLKVYKEALSPGGSYTQSTILTGLNDGAGVALDGSGNIYILDDLQTSVLKLTPTGTGYSQTTIGSGLFLPSGMAVDAVGNVYISSNGKLMMETLSSGKYTESDLYDGAPASVVVDSSENVFLIDSSSYTLVELGVNAPPTLTYGLQTDGTASAPQSVLLQNNGNAAFTSVSPGMSVAADFTQVAGSGTPADCAVPFSMAAGSSCNLSVEFTPVSPASGTVNGSVTLTDNNLNASPSGKQVIPLNGTAGTAGPTVTNVNPSSGTTGGNTPVIITGTNFTGATVVSFGSVAVSSFAVVSSTTITTTTPAGSPGTVDVTVTTPGGTSAINPSDQYTYTQYFSAIHSTLTASPTTTAAGTSSTVTATLLDENNLPIVGATVNFYTTGSATLSSITVTNASGVATALLTDTVAETVTLSATSAAPYAGSFAQTPKVTFTAGAAASVAVAGGSSQSTTVNTAFPAPLVVVVKDAYGNLVPNATVTAQAPVSSSPSATFSSIPVTGSNGQTSFTATANNLYGGPYNVTATVAGASTSATFALTNLAATQTINFTQPTTPVIYGAGTITLVASATSGLPVTYSIVAGNTASGNLVGNQLTLTSTGSITIAADQAGNGTYSAAPEVTRTILVNPATPVLAFTTIPARTYGDAPFTVVATSASNGAVTYGISSGAATVVSATGVVTLSGAGSITFTASQAATQNYTAANTQTTIAVGKQASKTTLGASSVSITPIQSVTLTATVASTIVGSPTQQVTFYDGGVQIGTAVTLSGGQAQLIVPSLLSGSHTITATYGGDTNFLTSNSNSVVIQVAPLDFTFAASGTTSQTVIPGLAANFTFALAPLYNIYPGTVTFTATGGPTGATYTFSPTTVAANGGAQPIGLSVQTLPELARNAAFGRSGPFAPVAFALLLPLLGLRKVRRKLGRSASLLLLLAASAFAVSSLAGCSQGVGFFGQPVQSYTITVTASSGSVQHIATVNLQVQ